MPDGTVVPLDPPILPFLPWAPVDAQADLLENREYIILYGTILPLGNTYTGPMVPNMARAKGAEFVQWSPRHGVPMVLEIGGFAAQSQEILDLTSG